MESIETMHWIDWVVVGAVMIFFIVLAYSTKKYTQSTSDFLAANRLAGRYLLTMADGVAGLGAVSIIARFQMVYKAGFAPNWWDQLHAPVMLLVMLTGWVAYRYRETRAMTLGQFFEVRYGRKFRAYAATICWISGIINFGIFPAVGANFFLYYTGLPDYYSLFGLVIPTYHTLLIVLLGLSLYFTFTGGQIAVLVTDFFQSFFVNIVLATILIIILFTFPLSHIFDGLKISEPGKSLLDPFDTANVEGFNAWYFLISLFALVINRNAWQGSQAYQVSARTPHEQKMAGVLGQFRGFTLLWALTLLPLVAYLIMHHPDHTDWAALVNAQLAQIPDEQVRDQMITPITMTLWMPIGLMGAFAAVMFAAFISTHDTYLHSWGSIFIQDIYLPLRGKEIDTKKHLRLLRFSIFGVAVFIFLFSSLYRQTQDILLFFALTGAFWLGGAGVVIVGGLYTKWGTTRGAFAGLTSGTVLATAGMICEHWWEDWYGEGFVLTGQEVYFCAMCVAWTLYAVFSLSEKHEFNVDKMLNRGQYAVASDRVATEVEPVKEGWNWRSALGVTAEFSRGDKLIYGFTVVKSLGLFGLWLGMTIAAFTVGISIEGWTTYHYWVNAVFFIVLTLGVMIWLTIGGLRDVTQLFKDLREAKRDFSDDGTVRDHDFELKDGASS
jgi:SSS family solute:Na+ symporter